MKAIVNDLRLFMFWWSFVSRRIVRKPIRGTSMKGIYHGSMKRGNQMVGQIDRLQLNAIQRWWNKAWICCVCSFSLHTVEQESVEQMNEIQILLQATFRVTWSRLLLATKHHTNLKQSYCKQGEKEKGFLFMFCILNVSENGNERKPERSEWKDFFYCLEPISWDHPTDAEILIRRGILLLIRMECFNQAEIKQ